MRTREIFGGETARFEQRHGQRIAHGEHRRGAGGGRKIERAGFLGHADVEMRHGGFGQRRRRIARHGQQRHAQTRHMRQQRQHLGCFAGIRHGQQYIVARDHADVAVTGFGGVQKESGCTGAGQRRGQLAANVPRFAHTGHHDATLATETGLAGRGKARVKARHQGFQAANFNRQCAPAGGQQRGCVGFNRGWPWCRRTAHDRHA